MSDPTSSLDPPLMSRTATALLPSSSQPLSLSLSLSLTLSVHLSVSHSRHTTARNPSTANEQNHILSLQHDPKGSNNSLSLSHTHTPRAFFEHLSRYVSFTATRSSSHFWLDTCFGSRDKAKQRFVSCQANGGKNDSAKN